MSEREQRLQQHKEIINRLILEIKTTNPSAEIIEREYSSELVYYTVRVVASKIKVSKETRSLYIKDNATKLLKNKFLTKNDAENAIKLVLPKALEHFNTCLKEYQELAKRLNFSLGFNYDGDTHGIYNEYEYISFELEGFYFQFKID